MAYNTGFRVSGVTPARRSKYERNLFYTAFSSSTDPGVASTMPAQLFVPAAGAASSFVDLLENESTRLDWLHIYFNPTCAASSFYVIYYNIDTTTVTHTMILSTAVLLANAPGNWVVPFPPRTQMSIVCNNATSTGYFMLQTAEAFGDQMMGNK